MENTTITKTFLLELTDQELLEKLAKLDDRSMSATLRQLIRAEAKRRNIAPAIEEQPVPALA